MLDRPCKGQDGEFDVGGRRLKDGLGDFLASVTSSLASDARTPRYELVAQALEEEIRSGRLGPGSALPPEPELARNLAISRQTVRHALKDLTGRGLLIRRRGVGTFVTGSAIEHPLGRLSSFVRTLSIEGAPPDSKLLGIRLMIDAVASPLLTGSAEGLVCEISRLFRADGEPVVLERIYLTPEIGELLPSDRLATAVVDEMLSNLAGIEVNNGEEVLQMARLNREEATMLEMSISAPVFLVTRTAFAADRPVELRRSLIRGDRARFRVALSAPER
jgi:DNA-binding GntR family transcriptional regulator